MKRPRSTSISTIATILAATIATLVAASCGSFPREQLCLDLTSSDIPVMLNSVDRTMVKGKILNYDAGYESRSITVSTGNGANSSTVTHTMAMNRNQPLGMQMQGLLISEPIWLSIQALSFKAYLIYSMYFNESSYTLRADVFVPAIE